MVWQLIGAFHECALSEAALQTIDKMGMGGVVGQIAGVVDQADNTIDGVRESRPRQNSCQLPQLVLQGKMTFSCTVVLAAITCLCMKTPSGVPS